MLRGTINGIEYKQANPPHDSKVLWKPCGDWVKSEHSVEDLRRAIKWEAEHEYRMKKKQLANSETRRRESYKRSFVSSKVDTADLVLEHLSKAGVAMSISKISEAVDCKESTVRAAIGRLYDKGLVSRGVDGIVEKTKQPIRVFKISKSGLIALNDVEAA